MKKQMKGTSSLHLHDYIFMRLINENHILKEDLKFIRDAVDMYNKLNSKRKLEGNYDPADNARDISVLLTVIRSRADLELSKIPFDGKKEEKVELSK